jgi:hypothetical protein
MPGARPLVSSMCRELAVCDDAAALRDGLALVLRRRVERGEADRFREGMVAR